MRVRRGFASEGRWIRAGIAGFQKDLGLFAFVLIGLKTILLSSIWGSSGLELGFQKDLGLFEFVFLAQFECFEFECIEFVCLLFKDYNVTYLLTNIGQDYSYNQSSSSSDSIDITSLLQAEAELYADEEDLPVSSLAVEDLRDLGLFAFVLIGLKTILLSSIWGSSGLELGFQKDLGLFEFVFLAQFECFEFECIEFVCLLFKDYNVTYLLTNMGQDYSYNQSSSSSDSIDITSLLQAEAELYADEGHC
ncbi:hypothetical protein F2Q68_00026136 [Brassica cretica]|uniref:Uncharacterized protein n=1 Tax=Brassica cretica TaxID=69181 RepID=A0A8S9IIE3_BRACR|nr:hypothetical protein F2Q68_00026136 [Brassica cretica]